MHNHHVKGMRCSITQLNSKYPGISYALQNKNARDPDQSFKYINGTGKPVYIKLVNGTIKKINPSISAVDIYKSSFIIEEYLRGDNLSSHVTKENHNVAEPETAYDFVTLDVITNRVAGNINRCVSRIVAPKALSEITDEGLYVADLGIRIFMNEEDALASDNILEVQPRFQKSDALGFDMVIHDPNNEYPTLFTNFMGEAVRVPVHAGPTGDIGMLVVNRYDREKCELVRESYPIEEILDREGKVGLRLYRNRDDAVSDINRPVDERLKEIHKAKMDEYLAELKMTKDLEIREIEEGHVHKLSTLQGEYEAVSHELERVREEVAEERRLMEVERVKSRKEDRWQKAKDKTGIWNRVVDTFGNAVRALGNIFAMV